MIWGTSGLSKDSGTEQPEKLTKTNFLERADNHTVTETRLSIAARKSFEIKINIIKLS